MVAKSWEVKKFDGKFYHRYGTEPTKEGAERTVKLLRSNGIPARYSKFTMSKRNGGGHFYIVWYIKR